VSAAIVNDPKAQIESLLKRWSTSLALHQRYASLDDERYRQVQPWPKHVRPVPLILNLAQQKLTALERIARQRSKDNDAVFFDALELMALLANLVGLQNIEHFVPLADGATERRDVLKVPSMAEAAAAETTRTGAQRTIAPRAAAARDDATRQMPALHPGKLGRMLLAQRVGVPYKPRSGKAAAAPKAPTAKAATGSKTVAAKPAPQSVEAMVVDDVIRLIGWGRSSAELPELIASLSGRPNALGVRKIIKEYRLHIRRQLGAS
jgi:hypothetical protein